jgi:hypothetical protein
MLRTSNAGNEGTKIAENKHRAAAREFLNIIEKEGGEDEDYYATAVELASLVFERLENNKQNVIELMNYNRQRIDSIETYQSIISSMIQKL